MNYPEVDLARAKRWLIGDARPGDPNVMLAADRNGTCSVWFRLPRWLGRLFVWWHLRKHA